MKYDMGFVESLNVRDIIQKSFGKEVKPVICKKCGRKTVKTCNCEREIALAGVETARVRALLLLAAEKIDKSKAVFARGSQ